MVLKFIKLLLWENIYIYIYLHFQIRLCESKLIFTLKIKANILEQLSKQNIYTCLTKQLQFFMHAEYK